MSRPPTNKILQSKLENAAARNKALAEEIKSIKAQTSIEIMAARERAKEEANRAEEEADRARTWRNLAIAQQSIVIQHAATQEQEVTRA